MKRRQRRNQHHFTHTEEAKSSAFSVLARPKSPICHTNSDEESTIHQHNTIKDGRLTHLGEHPDPW